jgi:ketosteroid isomerase-like protein
MPADRVEIVRRTAGQWNRRAWAEMEAALEPDVTVVPPEGWPEGDTMHGWPAWKRQIERLKDSWDQDHVEIEELAETGDKILVKYRWTMRGKDSGIPFAQPTWCVFTFRGDRVARMEYFMEESLALEAARASE